MCSRWGAFMEKSRVCGYLSRVASVFWGVSATCIAVGLHVLLPDCRSYHCRRFFNTLYDWNWFFPHDGNTNECLHFSVVGMYKFQCSQYFVGGSLMLLPNTLICFCFFLLHILLPGWHTRYFLLLILLTLSTLHTCVSVSQAFIASLPTARVVASTHTPHKHHVHSCTGICPRH